MAGAVEVGVARACRQPAVVTAVSATAPRTKARLSGMIDAMTVGVGVAVVVLSLDRSSPTWLLWITIQLSI
jgi:predicted benzoate:H+ symporter BenE